MTGNPADRAGAILEIDLAGIAANWRLLARRVEPAGCAAVVKADAYGLGAPLVAPALAAAGCRRTRWRHDVIEQTRGARRRRNISFCGFPGAPRLERVRREANLSRPVVKLTGANGGCDALQKKTGNYCQTSLSAAS